MRGKQVHGRLHWWSQHSASHHGQKITHVPKSILSFFHDDFNKVPRSKAANKQNNSRSSASVEFDKEWYSFNVNWSTQRRHKDETKNTLEPNHDTTTTALDSAVTIPTLTYPYTAATHTLEYSIQWLPSSPLNDGLSTPLEASSGIFGLANLTIQGLCAGIRNHW